MRKLIVASVVALAMSQMVGCGKVPVGYDGILVSNFGKTRGVDEKNPIVTGRVFVNPLTETLYIYPTFKQTKQFDDFSVTTSDGAQFAIDPSATINTLPGKTPLIYKTYRVDFDSVIKGPIQLSVQSTYREVMNKYTSSQIMTNRQKFESEVFNELNTILTSQGFQISQLSSNLRPPQQLVDSINLTQQATQEVLLSEQKLRVAEANSKTVVAAAQGTAKANEIINASLTPMLLQRQFIDKWSGSTPLYGQSPTLFKNVN